MSPRGRRPAGEDTRAQIVAVARAEFADKGYDATSLRAVARGAGVDPALVHHYFDGKQALFAATMQIPFNPRERVDSILDAPPERLGESLVRHFLQIWDAPEGRTRMVALLRSAAGQAEVGELLRGFLVSEVFGRVAAATRPDDVERRAGLVATQLVGLAFLRYIIELPAIAEAPADQLVADVAPTVQRYLDL